MKELLSLWNLDGPVDEWEVNPLLNERKQRLAEMGVRVEDLRKIAENCMKNHSNGCIEWGMARNKQGYGVLWMPKIKGLLRVHRVSFVAHGGILSKEMPVCCHKCDNPSCLNPLHLFSGTKKDNSQDMSRKKRGIFQTNPEKRPQGDNHFSRRHPEMLLRGESHKMSKLTNSMVLEIRRIREAQSIPYYLIAKMFNITKQNVISICKRKTWIHI